MECLTRIARDQHGVFSHVQARSVLSPARLRHLVDSGLVERRFDGVYRFTGSPQTWRSELLAACFAGGSRGVASHRSAAALWNLPGGARDVVEITCPRWRRARHAGLVVHESTRLEARDLTVVDSIPVTSPAMTLLHLGAVSSPQIVELAYQKALRLRFTTWDDCDLLLARYARRGRSGVAALRTVLRRRDPRQAPTESEMETIVLQVLRRFGLPEPETQHEIERADGAVLARVDFAYPGARVAIEYQSEAYHAAEVDRIRDNRRRNELRAIDWEVIEVRKDVRQDPTPFVRALRAALTRSEIASRAAS